MGEYRSSIKAPTSAELTQLAHTIAHRLGRFLERRGLLERDVENSYLAGEAVEAGPLDQLLGHSITYRIAVGPNQGRKVFTLQTLPATDEPYGDGIGEVGGLLRASCPSPSGPAFGCSKSLLAILSPCTPVWRRERSNARSWRSSSQTTSVARRSRRSACRSPRTETSATS